MQDVAAAAGVSLKSVSRVVNREAGVSDALVERVETAVQKLGYRHNLAASFLRRGQRTESIGMLVQDLSNGYCGETLRVVEDHARERGVVVMAASTDEDPAREREIVHGLIARRIDGLILMPTDLDLSWLAADIGAGLVVVALDRLPAFPPVDAVVVDNQGGSAEAVGHLMAHGHRRIALLGDEQSIPTARDRHAGYTAALRSGGITPDPELVRTGLRTRAQAFQATLDLLDLPDPPTALFAARDTACDGAVRALQSRGRGHDVALVGFDDLALADVVVPRLTVVRQDTREIGRRAVDLLLRRLDGDTSPVRVEIVPTTLVARGSGEIPAPAPAAEAG
ncbi:LacI family DNA-binding transcriptional regulator [Nocardioides korecus]